MASDRLFGLVAIVVALGFIASATQLQVSFLSDPVGPKTFPLLIGSVMALCGLVMVFQPDEEPQWPVLRTLGTLAIAVAIMVAYAYMLKPLGFLIPTAITAAVLSYQIYPKPVAAVLSGIGLSIGLFVLFKYALGLGLIALPFQ